MSTYVKVKDGLIYLQGVITELSVATQIAAELTQAVSQVATDTHLAAHAKLSEEPGNG